MDSLSYEYIVLEIEILQYSFICKKIKKKIFKIKINNKVKKKFKQILILKYQICNFKQSKLSKLLINWY